MLSFKHVSSILIIVLLLFFIIFVKLQSTKLGYEMSELYDSYVENKIQLDYYRNNYLEKFNYEKILNNMDKYNLKLPKKFYYYNESLEQGGSFEDSGNM